jgi:two-component system sensor histidine kinase KdpD
MKERPDPDQLLKLIQAEGVAEGRGKLKLFFGASAGVGKTYSMLEAARQRKKEGWDVVVGIVETHGRAETAALLEGLEILARKKILYKGAVLEEFDLDAALARRPRLLLVDELAHTNAPGSRHSKRWQDVSELLEAGIDVYTTVNVQHWESLNDVVAKITGVQVRETVPDSFLKTAHELELVDLPPEELLQRLKEGKVYRGETAGRAADNFFQAGNLIALRELALRHAAERVDAQMQAFKDLYAIKETWPVGERLLVAVGPSTMSGRLVRATSRLAARLHCPWIAIHVETPAFWRLPPEERALVVDNLRLAQRLGGETVTLTGQDISKEILKFSRTRNVTKIILGKPARPRWKELLFGSIVNDLARHAGDIDLYVISGEGVDINQRERRELEESTPRKNIVCGIAIVLASTLISWPLFRHVDRANLIMIYLVGVALVAYRFGRASSIIASVLSVLFFDFFFVPPYLSFAISDTQYFFTFAVMLGVGVLISSITSRLHLQTEEMSKRESRIRTLYRLSLEL